MLLASLPVFGPAATNCIIAVIAVAETSLPARKKAIAQRWDEPPKQPVLRYRKAAIAVSP